MEEGVTTNVTTEVTEAEAKLQHRTTEVGGVAEMVRWLLTATTRQQSRGRYCMDEMASVEVTMAEMCTKLSERIRVTAGRARRQPRGGDSGAGGGWRDGGRDGGVRGGDNGGDDRQWQ